MLFAWILPENLDAEGAFRSMRSHKNGIATFHSNDGKRWQTIGCPAECAWPVLVPFRNWKESDKDSDKLFSTPMLTVNGGGGFN